METVKKCYDFLVSPQPVADFQQLCFVKRKHKTCATNGLGNGIINDNKQSHCSNGTKSPLISETSNSILLNDTVTDNHNQNHTEVTPGSLGQFSKTENFNNVKKRKINNNKDTESEIYQNGTNDVHALSKQQDIVNPDQSDTTDPASDYIIGSYLIFAIFRFGAELGNEFFYLIFYTYCMWSFDSFICLKIVTVWVLLMYVGQSLKDVIRWPRPASPPVFQLENRYHLEYGMPSTHAMVGAAIPFMMLMFTTNRYEYEMWYGIIIAVSWCTLVCLSRIYLGMHNILDIIAGLVLVTIILAILVPYADTVVLFLTVHQYGGLINVVAAILLIVVYPASDKWSTARGDTTVFFGVASGMNFGSWLNYQMGLLTPSEAVLPHPNFFGESNFVMMSLYRMLIGVIVAVVIRFLMKLLAFNFFCYLLNKDRKAPETRQCLIIELPYKYLSYFVVAVFSTHVTPMVFSYLGILRASYYSEIL